MTKAVKAVGGLIYEVGERVLTRFGWGSVTHVQQESYPEDVTDKVTFECTVRLDQPTSLGDEEVLERNPRKYYRWALFSHWWVVGDPAVEAPTVQYFTEEERDQAELEFSSAGATSGQVLTLVLVDFKTKECRVRMLTVDGEVDHHPPPE